MIINNSVPLYSCGLDLVHGHNHLRELIRDKKSICFRINKEKIQVYPASWFINLNYGYAATLLMNCVYVYDKKKIKEYGLQ